MEDIFSAEGVNKLTARINNLRPESQPKWGKMNVSQMLKHCNVAYEMVYDNIHPKPTGFKKFLLKKLVKNYVTSEKPFKQSVHTAPQFLVGPQQDFEKEKTDLTNYLKKTKDLGAAHFDGMESHSFGKLNRTEWNNMFAKHLDHHLTQFGV